MLEILFGLTTRILERAYSVVKPSIWLLLVCPLCCRCHVDHVREEALLGSGQGLNAFKLDLNTGWRPASTGSELWGFLVDHQRFDGGGQHTGEPG